MTCRQTKNTLLWLTTAGSKHRNFILCLVSFTKNSKLETRNPIKVLHLFVTLPVGGAEDLLASIITGLDPDKFVAEVACLGAAGPVGEELRRQGRTVYSLHLDIKHDSFLKKVRGVRALIKSRRPQILHTHLYHPNLYGRLASLGMGLKGVVASIHNAYTRVKLHRCLANYLLAWVTDKILVSSFPGLSGCPALRSPAR